tara:strand:+ start:531 stop:719 length:189 start_codon:yes stop_codon:yes gene_type:complete
MAQRKICKKCNIFVDGPTCPICKGNQFSTSWRGRIYIVDPNKSLIAQKIGKTVKGEYAIKKK